MYDQILLSVLRVHHPNTLYEITGFLRNVETLRSLNIIQLVDLALLVQVKQFQEGERIAYYASEDEMDALLVYSGQVALQWGRQEEERLGEKALVCRYTLKNKLGAILKVTAATDCVVYQIRKKPWEAYCGDQQLFSLREERSVPDLQKQPSPETL
ncbi:MAG: hypothetical protein HC880_05020 [Bacteroidia bacterium]|nr:hypothetical protein [Bacteroidia bacterium]